MHTRPTKTPRPRGSATPESTAAGARRSLAGLTAALLAGLLAALLATPGAMAAESTAAAAEAPTDALPAPADLAALRDLIEAELRRQKLAGAVWSMADADGGIAVGAAGERDAVRHLPMTEDTQVHIGSVTKTLIAVGALILVSEGRLALDAPVEPQLDGVRFENPWSTRHPVTLRTLLDHTAGLDDARLSQMFSLRASPDQPLREAFAEQGYRLPVRKPPGAAFSYSNTGYTLVAMAIESVVGGRYETWLERALLQPLGMRDSSFGFVDQAAPGGERLAWGHLDDLRHSGALAVALRPAAQFTTTAGDMARFAQFLLGDGRAPDGSRLVDARLLRAMGHPSDTRAVRAGLPSGYGLGLGRQVRGGVAGECHSGNIVGFRAMLCRYPEQRRAFFLAINTDAENADYRRFDALMVDALGLPSSATGDDASPAAAAAPPVSGRFVIDPSRFERFRYLDLLTAVIALEPVEDGIELRRFGGSPRLLQPVSVGPDGSRLYATRGEPGITHVLHREQDGRLWLSDGYRTHVQIADVQWWGLWINLGLGVAGLLWFLLVAPWRCLRRPPSTHPPTYRPYAGVLMAWGLALAAPWFLLQPMVAIGDPTIASVWLYIASGATVPLLLYQLWRSLRHRGRLARLDAVAAIAVLQWCAVLAATGALPFALWR